MPIPRCDRHAITDADDSADSSDSALANEPTLNTDTAEPTLPILNTEPTEPMDNAELVE